MKNKTINTVLLLSLLIVFIGCDNSDDPVTPNNMSISLQTTNETAKKTYTTIEINAKVNSTGESPILNRGICWSLTPDPTVENNFVNGDSNEFTTTVTDLIVNTVYYFRAFVTDETGITTYSGEEMINTLSLDNTSWKFTTIYPDQNNYEIISKVDFSDDGTSKFDEMDLPGQCHGCFITYGTWSTSGNILTYIWEGTDPDISTYIYTGLLEGASISGTYAHATETEGPWNATQL